MGNDNNILCEDLSAWLDGELEQPRRQQVADALQADPALREELNEVQAVRQRVRALPHEKAPGDFVVRVLAEAERGKLFGSHHAERESGFFRWARYASIAAVLLVAASVGFVVYSSLWQAGGPRSGVALLAPRDEEAGRAEKARESDREAAARDYGKAYDKPADKTADGPTGRSLVVDGGTLKIDGDAFGKDGTGAGGGKDFTTLNGALAAKSGASAGGAQTCGGTVCEVGKEVIYTDHLEVTRRQVESILVANGIQSAEQSPGKGGREAMAKGIAPRGNFYKADQLAAKAVEYEVFVTPEQLAGVQNGLDSIRGRQKVSQATEEADADTALREKGAVGAERHGKSGGDVRRDDMARAGGAKAGWEKTPEDAKTKELEKTGEKKAAAGPDEAGKHAEWVMAKPAPAPARPERQPKALGGTGHAAKPDLAEIEGENHGKNWSDSSRPIEQTSAGVQAKQPVVAGEPLATSEQPARSAPAPFTAGAGQGAGGAAASSAVPKAELVNPEAAAPSATPAPAPVIAPTPPTTRPSAAATTAPAEPEAVVQTEMIAATNFANPEPAKQQEPPGAAQGAFAGHTGVAAGTLTVAPAGGAPAAAPATQPAPTQDKLNIAQSFHDANGRNVDLQAVLSRSAGGQGYNSDLTQQQRATSQAANIASARLQRLRIVVNQRSLPPEALMDAASTRQAEQMKINAAEKK